MARFDTDARREMLTPAARGPMPSTIGCRCEGGNFVREPIVSEEYPPGCIAGALVAALKASDVPPSPCRSSSGWVGGASPRSSLGSNSASA
eukprot:scaffold112175_cov33-Tisochrysis_lutea.AAC.5